MNASATRKTPGAIALRPTFCSTIGKRLRAAWEKWVPIGYQDESGFHVGTEKPPGEK
jgi:hypothetical protein